MLVKQMVYVLCLFLFLCSIIVLIYAIKNKKRNMCKYIILLSVIYMFLLLLDIEFLPLLLNLSIGFELFIFRAFALLAGILLICSIVISGKKAKKSELYERSKRGGWILLLLFVVPVILFASSYLREMYYINNSELILVCSRGESFSTEYYGYAINDNYCKEISVGTDFKGYEMAKHLPKEYHEHYYNWETDRLEVDEDRIVVYSNEQLIYEGKLRGTFSAGDLERVFYK